MNFEEELNKILHLIENEVSQISSLDELEKVRIKYLGRKSYLANFPSLFKNLDTEDKKKIGFLYNQVKSKIISFFEEKKKNFTESEIDFDFYHPGYKRNLASLNLITQELRKIIQIFLELGFIVIDSPELVNEYENFDSLNIPPYHPARDMWSTIWLKNPPKYLLRTHTSSFQVPFLKKYKPPINGVIPGKVFRFEATDSRHDFEFHQLEGISVGKENNLSHLRFIFEEFFNRYFKEKIKLRFRPSYFPFTEPSVEIDLSCILCSQKGCEVCKKTGWLEVAGAGMIHPFILKEANIDKNKFQGYAFGTGIERLIMLKYKINDIRILHSFDLRVNEI